MPAEGEGLWGHAGPWDRCLETNSHAEEKQELCFLMCFLERSSNCSTNACCWGPTSHGSLPSLESTGRTGTPDVWRK